MYNIKIDYISFESFTKERIVIRNDLSLGEVKLSIDVNLLEEVEVRAERTEVNIIDEKKYIIVNILKKESLQIYFGSFLLEK